MNGMPHDDGLRNNTHGFRGTSAMPATVLLVEDEPAVRMVTREALELGGYRVIEADGPAAAMRLAADPATIIDLVLTDMIMPGMNGADLARRVREMRPGLITLFMTGYAESDALRLATLEVKHKHIQKPFTVSGLLARVADALATRWNTQDLQAPQYPAP